MRQIIAKRAKLSLFDEAALEELIDKTGGCIRELFRCISNAAIRAQLREHYKSFTGLRRVGI